MISESAVTQLKPTIRGEILLPASEGYDSARKVHNGMIDKRPAIIVCCAGVADVIAAVNFAREHRLLVAVRGSGHNVAGISVCDDGMVIDLSRMNGIHVRPAARTVRVEAGATWAEVNHELQPFGLAATGGFVGTTGVSGLTLGGGLGWLVRKHGLALDNLLSADIVTADGRLLTSSATENQDLFWGIRGGGGNFGIATSFEFQAHPVGTVLAGLVLYPLSQGKAVLQNWRKFEATAPDEYTGGALIFSVPAELPLPDALKQGPIVAVGGVYAGPLDEGERVLKPLRSFGPPVADIFQPMPYSAAQSMADFLWPRGMNNYWKSNFMKEAPSDSALEMVLSFCAKVPSPHTVMLIEHNGDSALDRSRDDATAFGHRNWPYNFLITAEWTDPAQSDANIRWTREFWTAMQPYLASDAYVNYLGEVGEKEVRSAYRPDKYERLVALKTKYDPTNFFRLNQNIRPKPQSAVAD